MNDFYESYSFFIESKRGRHELGFFLSRVRPRDVVYDIGAFRGVYGVAAKAAFRGSVDVHLFEPITGNWQSIEEIARLNCFDRFNIVGQAVGDGKNISGLIQCADGMFRASNSIKRPSLVEMASTSIDSYIRTSNTVPTLMKIDVEGFEIEVLDGARECLSRNRPRLWIELHPTFLRAKGRDWTDAIDILRENGYGTISFYVDKHLPTQDVAFHVWCES